MSSVDNTPTPCNPPSSPPAGAALVSIRWYIHWPILLDLGPAPAAGLDVYINEVHQNGGVVWAVSFMDASGNPLPGLDGCGNPIGPPPPPPGGGDGGGEDDDGSLIVTPPPGFPPPPPYGAPDNDGDELTNDLCTQLRADTKRVVYTLNELLYYAKLSGGTESCCAAIESALGSIASILGAIEKELAASHVTVDLTPLVDAVTTLKASLDALSPAMSDDTDKLVAALDGIKSALPQPDPCVCEELKKLNTGTTEAQAANKAFVDYLEQQGFIDATEAQILGG